MEGQIWRAKGAGLDPQLSILLVSLLTMLFPPTPLGFPPTPFGFPPTHFGFPLMQSQDPEITPRASSWYVSTALFLETNP